MRLNEEHAYDDRVCYPPDILKHIVPEYRFRQFIQTVSKHKGQITAFYALITFVAYMFPEEFPTDRVEAMKKVAYKVFVAYHEEPPLALMCKVMKERKVPPRVIAKQLNIKRENIYYYMNKEAEVPAQCMLTHGEFNLMMDFMDAWDQIKMMGEL